MIYAPDCDNSVAICRFDDIGAVKEAINARSICYGVVELCDSERRMHIDLGAVEGIVPYSEGAIGIGDWTRDIALISRVGKIISFRIIGLHREDGRWIAVLSRRIVQQECMDSFVSRLVVGDVIDARISSLAKFGAFVDIGAGINSLIPIDMLSVSRISRVSDRVRVGQDIRCVLRSIDGDRLTFSIKELLGTWQENADLFCAGDTVSGIVRSVEDYGIFVELMPNLVGLAERSDGLVAGMSVAVYIKSINPDKMKIKLAIVGVGDIVEDAPALRYFDTSRHISRWIYSPIGAIKDVRTIFE